MVTHIIVGRNDVFVRKNKFSKIQLYIVSNRITIDRGKENR